MDQREVAAVGWIGVLGLRGVLVGVREGGLVFVGVALDSGR